ncbi:MAG TPA: hypothetical protein VLZ74_07545 [Methylocella sp.]|nr:hypothetical protein [Methylocella sp.]
MIAGLAGGIAYRARFDTDPPELANYLRSALRGAGVALAGWAEQTGFA